MRRGALLLLAMMLVPAAAAQEGDLLCIIFFEPSIDFRLVDVKADLILTPDERANLSARVDADADGVITAQEVSMFENGTTVEVTGDASQYGERLLYMDGNLPTRMTVYTKLRNWTGPVEEARKGVVTEIREYHTTPANDVGHILSGGLYAVPDSFLRQRPVIETIVINAPDGWVVWEVGHAPVPATPEGNSTLTPQPPTYQPGGGTRYLRQSVQISAFDIRRQYTVSFAKEGEDPTQIQNGSPGPELAAVLVAVAALAVATRRKR